SIAKARSEEEAIEERVVDDDRRPDETAGPEQCVCAVQLVVAHLGYRVDTDGIVDLPSKPHVYAEIGEAQTCDRQRTGTTGHAETEPSAVAAVLARSPIHGSIVLRLFGDGFFGRRLFGCSLVRHGVVFGHGVV